MSAPEPAARAEALPSGWVGFLFTDIEGSTLLHERLGPLYRALHQRHDVLLRECFARHGGLEFKHTGDGFEVAFADAALALACAIDAQAALSVESWPAEAGPLRARMALHWGEAGYEGGDYHGLALHRAARVLSATHGGQILCTCAFVAALQDSMQAGLHDEGLFRLRDVRDPVRLFQVPFPGMDKRARQPRAAPAHTHQLPPATTRFFGRSGEMRELLAQLLPQAELDAEPHAGRLVTLLGPGGTGKTRLALAVAARLLAAYDHAVWFVPLADLRDPQLLAGSVRDALRLPADPADSPLDQVIALLGRQPSLLVLDNFEQIADGGAPIVQALLARLPQLACVVTSRQRLGIGGEREFLLTPLDTPPGRSSFDTIRESESVQLFADRAQCARSSFALAPANAQAVAELCRTLEGMPLAIELAAARSGALSPGEILARLGDRLDFLAARQRDLPERHRTLRAAIQWSFELLSTSQRTLFLRLSIFRGGWTLEAAQAVAAGGDPAVLDGLAELRDCSLILAEERDGRMRYRMLETIRAFASEQLRASGERPEIEARHRRFFHDLACGAAATLAMDDAERLRVLEAENENLRAVFGRGGPVRERAEMAIPLRVFWMVRGYVAEGRAWLRALLGEIDDDAQRAIVQNEAGILAWCAGDLAESRALLEGALPAMERCGDRRLIAAMLNNLGIVTSDQGDLDAASGYYQRGLAIYRQLGLRSQMAAVLSNIGSIALARRQPEASRPPLEEALAVQRDLGECFNCANTLHNLAEMHLLLGAFAAARRHLAESLELRRLLGTQEHTVASFTTLAQIALAEGDSGRESLLWMAAWRGLEAGGSQPDQEARLELDQHIARLRSQMSGAAFAQLGEAARKVVLSAVLTSDGTWAATPIQPQDNTILTFPSAGQIPSP